MKNENMLGRSTRISFFLHFFHFFHHRRSQQFARDEISTCIMIYKVNEPWDIY